MGAKASCMKAEGEVGHKGSTLIPTGINVIDGERIDEPELEQENFVTGAMDVAVNVNTLGDLQRAEFLLEQAEKEQRRFRRAVNKRRDNTRRF
jgi:GTP:adenosylcobinamide-phosphate guanylyltransferase